MILTTVWKITQNLGSEPKYTQMKARWMGKIALCFKYFVFFKLPPPEEGIILSQSDQDWDVVLVE